MVFGKPILFYLSNANVEVKVDVVIPWLVFSFFIICGAIKWEKNRTMRKTDRHWDKHAHTDHLHTHFDNRFPQNAIKPLDKCTHVLLSVVLARGRACSGHMFKNWYLSNAINNYDLWSFCVHVGLCAWVCNKSQLQHAPTCRRRTWTTTSASPVWQTNANVVDVVVVALLSQSGEHF